MNLYDVVSGSVNSDVAKPYIKYSALINVSADVPHMVAIIHFDVKGQSRELTLRDLHLDIDPLALWPFVYDFIKSSANAPLIVTPYSVSAMLEALQQEDTTGYLAKLKCVYVATMQAEVGSVANTARYEDVASIQTLLMNETIASATLTFNLK